MNLPVKEAGISSPRKAFAEISSAEILGLDIFGTTLLLLFIAFQAVTGWEYSPAASRLIWKITDRDGRDTSRSIDEVRLVEDLLVQTVIPAPARRAREASARQCMRRRSLSAVMGEAGL
jgi:hypothetical protein